jgi:aminotransferase in exopolysaccharide biosynthesis
MDQLVSFVREVYGSHEPIALHEPVFTGREKEYVNEAIDSTYVSSIGKFVTRFELDLAAYTGSQQAVATVNGTAALHVALVTCGVGNGDLVITQSLTFIATCNAIRYCGADPVFVDVDTNTLGLSPLAMRLWLEEHAFVDDHGQCRHTDSMRAIKAALPMHTFGHPADLDGLVAVCRDWHLVLIEDAAESLGSFYKGQHTGTVGALGTLSFNGNKTITTGGGGAVLNSTSVLATRVKHLTTTAKQAHAYDFVHDELAFNYRMPNINAALGCAQLEQLSGFIKAKRELAFSYKAFLVNSDWQFIDEPEGCQSNFWLNAVLCENRSQRDALLSHLHSHGILSRPSWTPMHLLPMHTACMRGPLPHTERLFDTLVNLPSGVPAARSA